jgi:hypothetical protein
MTITKANCQRFFVPSNILEGESPAEALVRQFRVWPVKPRHLFRAARVLAACKRFRDGEKKYGVAT